MKKSKLILSAAALILSMVILFTSCTGYHVSSIAIPDGAVKKPSNAGDKFHTTSSSAETVSKTEFLELIEDKENFCVSIKDKTTEKIWNSLPSDKNSYAYAFGITLYTKQGIFELNTQDNCVSFGSSSDEKKDGGLTVSYVLSDKKETANKKYEDLTSDDIYVSFKVDYSLSAQTMNVSVDCSQIKCSPDAVPASIEFLPYFGSEKNVSDGDYIFVPDGSGAIMNLSQQDTATKNVSVAIYGNDPNSDTVCPAEGTIPVYGIKCGTSAFAAVINNGDALAAVNAVRPSNSDMFSVGARFSVANTIKSDVGNSVFYGNVYSGKISVDYKFLSGDSANYVGMATAARENFIKSGYLSSSKFDNTGSIPFCLAVIGSFDDKNLATATQTRDMLSVLKGKGINNILLEYKGLLSGGIMQKNLYKAKINKSLGGKNELSELYEYMQKQNYKFFVDINIFSSYTNYSGSSSAVSVSTEKMKIPMKNVLAADPDTNNRLSSRITPEVAAAGRDNKNISMYSGDMTYDYNVMSISEISENFSSFLSGRFSNTADGFILNDAGSVLYSDINTDRQSAKNLIAMQSNAVSGQCSLGVNSGNIYTLYNADHVSGMMFDTYYPESDAYEPVPFAQAVLHGYTAYTGEPIDAADPLYRFDMLQCIEYGAMPYFQWVFDDSSIFYYGYYVLSEKISDIVDFYKKANDMLSDLSSETIIKHEKITTDSNGKDINGVYCTSYSNGTDIYVNYTGSVVTTSGNIVIEPYNCVRIDR